MNLKIGVPKIEIKFKQQEKIMKKNKLWQEKINGRKWMR